MNKHYSDCGNMAQELMGQVENCPKNDEKRATAVGFTGLGHIHANLITAQERATFAQAFLDKFNFPPTETVLQIKYNEFMNK